MRKQTIAAVALAVPLVLSACMQGGGQDAGALDEEDFRNPVAGEVGDGVLEGTTMTFVSWGGEFQNGQEQAFSQPFAEASGADLLSDGPTDIARIQAQVESGNVAWDVVNASPTLNSAHCGTLFEELDLSLIDTSKIPEGTPEGDCFLPSQSYVYGFFYDADRYGEDPPDSWADFFDTENYPGVRAVEGRPTPTAGTFEAALLADGVAPEELYPLDVERALEVWDGVQDDSVFWQSGAEQTQMVQAGEADMIFGWSGRIFEANENGANFAPVWNQGFLASDSFSITKDTPNRLAAYAYINFALGAQQQEEMAELTSYSPVNTDSAPDFSPAAAEFDVSRPEVLEQTIAQNPVYWGENLDELSEDWTGWLNS
ncbi:ABC transporter substrate-binding protein [Brevibacterium album]|uniref:ABC transporter substrate-binding protein n=1 Tax=Brevibacterium album TaxID=417948 RepID=UPI0003F63184|nr:ABC transporter substrate-binding protein [Brevibacterium album]